MLNNRKEPTHENTGILMWSYNLLKILFKILIKIKCYKQHVDVKLNNQCFILVAPVSDKRIYSIRRDIICIINKSK